MDDEPQDKEQDDLGKPGEAVEEPLRGSASHEVTVRGGETDEEDRHEAAAVELDRDGEHEERPCQSEDRVQPLLAGLQTVGQMRKQKAACDADHRAHAHFEGEADEEPTPRHLLGRQGGFDPEHGEEDGHGIVDGRLELDEVLHARAQPDAAAAQDAEDRRRVGARKHRPEKESDPRREAEQPRCGEPQRQRREQDSEGRQSHGGKGHRAYRGPRGVQSTTIEDQDEAQVSDHLGKPRIGHHASVVAVGSRDHPDAKEEQQERNTQPVEEARQCHAGEDQSRADEIECLDPRQCEHLGREESGTRSSEIRFLGECFKIQKMVG
jgi:hypothetical protein